MADKKVSLGKEFTKGLIKENPVLRLVLGTCPTLAISTSVVNALGMGISAMIVLVCSNIVISALRKVIPSKVRIPAYIVIIASFVTIVQMLVKAFVPALDSALGVFLPLIVVNCIILARAESFASKNKPLPSVADGFFSGIGFMLAQVCMCVIREMLGNGSFFGKDVMPSWFSPSTLIVSPAGGFLVLGGLIALVQFILSKKKKKGEDK